MKIYVGHSSSLNYKENLYHNLRNSDLNKEHTIILPHENPEEQFNSKNYLKNKCDVFIAEVSKASTGLGIEIGWADLFKVPIICIHREGSKPSSSIPQITDNIKSYQDSREMVEVIEESIKLE